MLNVQAYLAGKETGQSSILRHANGVYLVKWPGGEQGFLKLDIERYLADASTLKAKAEQAVMEADQRTIAKAGEFLAEVEKEAAAHDVLLADIAKA